MRVEPLHLRRKRFTGLPGKIALEACQKQLLSEGGVRADEFKMTHAHISSIEVNPLQAVCRENSLPFG